MKFTITDGSIPTPVPAEPILFEYPIPGSDARLYKRKFYVDLESYSRLPLGRHSPEYPDMYLVDESVPTRVGNTQRCTFVRTYANIPSPTTEYSTVSVTFPGFNSPSANIIDHKVFGSILSMSVPQSLGWRTPFQLVVTLRLKSVYYWTYNPDNDIPIHTSYNGLGKYLSNAGLYTSNTVIDIQPQYNEIISYAYDDKNKPIKTVIEYLNTLPTLNDYKNRPSIVVEPTKLERWYGHIWRATTGWVDAL